MAVCVSPCHPSWYLLRYYNNIWQTVVPTVNRQLDEKHLPPFATTWQTVVPTYLVNSMLSDECCKNSKHDLNMHFQQEPTATYPYSKTFKLKFFLSLKICYSLIGRFLFFENHWHLLVTAGTDVWYKNVIKLPKAELPGQTDYCTVFLKENEKQTGNRKIKYMYVDCN